MPVAYLHAKTDLGACEGNASVPRGAEPSHLCQRGCLWKKGFAILILLCSITAMEHAASGQATVAARLVSSWCYPELTENGWEFGCNVYVTEGDVHVRVAAGRSPTWAPDGLRIAFTDGASICILNRADGSIVPLAGDLPPHDQLTWSPDGGRIAFVGRVVDDMTLRREPELYVMAADGSNPTRLTDSVGFNDSYVWSPDGGAIASDATLGVRRSCHGAS